ncbi:hypothetical protein OCQ_18420 [Mycobacterium paraintracellulare]|nr:hypothetical protein OCQ_18420 [Mycobacterium paraintracellulare]
MPAQRVHRRPQQLGLPVAAVELSDETFDRSAYFAVLPHEFGG